MSALMLPNPILTSGILPEYWFITFDDKTGKYYFFNIKTRERTWNLLEVLSSSPHSEWDLTDVCKLTTQHILKPPDLIKY